MKKTCAYRLLALATLFLSGCAGLVDEKSVLKEIEKTKQEALKTQQFGMYYKNRAPEAESLAAIAEAGGVAAEVAAAGVSSAAPPGAVFAPAPPQGETAPQKNEALVVPDRPDPVCNWAPIGVVCPQ